MKRHIRRLSVTVFCFLLVTTLFAEYNNNISDNLFKYLLQKNIQVVAQYLENSQSEQFPYNIILSSYSAKESDNPLYFILPQEDASDNMQLITSLTRQGTVVLCANMKSDLPETARPSPLAGLKTFLAAAPENAVIVLLSESSRLSVREMELIPGGNGYIASREVVQSIIHAGQLTDFTISIQSFLLTFYRLNWVDGSAAAALCLENGFQAVELVVPEKASTPQLELFASKLSSQLRHETISEGTQYSIINTGTRVITLSESLYTTSLFIVIAITLLSTCLLSFMFGKFKLENRRIFLKWWYTGPLLVLITFALTKCAQIVVTALFTNYAMHPVWAVSLKIAFMVFSFLLLCMLRYIIPLAETDYLYSFFMTLAAALDVLIFTSIDMPLLLPFLIFYIIVIAARPIKKWWIRIIIFAIVSSPLLFILAEAAPYLRSDIFASFTDSPPMINFVTGALFLPYLLMVICIFISLGIWNKNKSFKRKIIEMSVLSGLLLFTVILSATVYRNDEPLPETDGGITGISEDAVLVSADAEIRNGMLFFEIALTGNDAAASETECRILRHDISVKADTAVPVFSANIPFSFADTAGSAYFRLDENPCSPFIVSGTSPDQFPIEFTITTWLKKADEIMIEGHSVIITEENAGKKAKVRAIIK